MTEKERVYHSQDIEWSELSDFPGSAQGKVLRETKELGAKTLLVRLPAGGKVHPHSHRGVVQHYVLEGQYETEGQWFGSGSFRLMPKNADVAPISTGEGVTILMIYDPIT